MRNFYLTVAISLCLFVSCGGDSGEEDGIISPVENTAPSIPAQVFPLNNTLCIDNKVVLEWKPSTDTENNSISYKIELSENSSFTPIAISETSLTTSKWITLAKGKAYFWRVKAVDSKKAESEYSTVSQFLTEGIGEVNHVPFSPELVAPALNSEISGTSTTLSWTASDIDKDVLMYDVFFGTNSNPTTKVSSNQTDKTYIVSGLTVGNTYYFKVVVKDNKGGLTVGQIWSFKSK